MHSSPKGDSNTSSSQSTSSGPTIGLRINWLGGYYQRQIWQGIVQSAQNYGMNVITFAGGTLKASELFLSEANAVYDLVNNQTIDGLVVVAGDVHDEMVAFFERRRKGR